MNRPIIVLTDDHEECARDLAEARQQVEKEREERLHWEAEHAALWHMVNEVAEKKPGATGRRLREILEGSGNLPGVGA